MTDYQTIPALAGGTDAPVPGGQAVAGETSWGYRAGVLKSRESHPRPLSGKRSMPKSLKALLIVPANNTTMEPEIIALCPELTQVLVARVRRPMRTLSADDMAGYGEATIEAVAPFVSERPDIVVHGCTAGGFLAGPEGNARIVAELERATGAPVVSTADAMVEALRHDGVRTTTVVTPYLPSVNEGLTRYVHAGGIEVDRLSSFLCETTEALGAVTEPQVLEKALATVTPGGRALFIACSQLPTLNIIVPLRERLGIPVWSSIRATAWAVSRRLAAQGDDASRASTQGAPVPA
jgi:maleate cis-trans isomerase